MPNEIISFYIKSLFISGWALDSKSNYPLCASCRITPRISSKMGA